MYDKPGCFGYASTYDAKSKACQSCEHSNLCSVSALRNLEELSQRLNVAALVKTKFSQPKPASEKRKPVKDSNREKVLSQFSDTTRRVAEILLDLRVPLRKELERGVNPVGNSPSNMKVLFDELIKGETTRAGYIKALIESGYSEGSAAAQASVGIRVATGLRIANVDERGNITLRRGMK